MRHLSRQKSWLILVAFLAGCAHRRLPTTAERNLSFAPYENTQIDSLPARSYVARRTAMLFAGANVTTGDPAAPETLHLRLSGRGRYSSSTATAIDRRGYFLTTGHSVERSPLFVIYFDGGGMSLAPARVVWRGHYEQHQPDLAVLHIDRPLPEAFTWTNRYQAGNRLLAAGPEYDRPEIRNLVCFAGELLRVVEHPDNNPPRTSIFHSAPVHPGDSGGPLTTTDGRLVAINIGNETKSEFSVLSSRTASRAHRPCRSTRPTSVAGRARM